VTLPGAAQPVPQPIRDPRWGAMALAIALLALLASVTSLHNGFSYDDRWIVVENPRLHALRTFWHYFGETYWPTTNGGKLYRPFVILAYAVQWAVGGGAPLVFHLVNVGLAVACAMTVFWVAGFLVAPPVAWLAAALFAVHPVHVEAIANVVGQAELWTALLVLLAFGLYARDRRDGSLRRRTGVGICALFIVALGTKENGIVLPALFLAAETLFYRDGTVWQRLRRLRWLLWPMLALVAIYLVIRIQVAGDIAGDIEHPSLSYRAPVERAFIMLGVAPEYGRLLLWPARLYADYSPRMLMVYPAPHASQIGGALLVVCLVALLALTVRRAPAVAFGVAWFALTIAPVTNVAIPTGVLLAERTLYLPSAGVLVAIAFGLQRLSARVRLAVPAWWRRAPHLLAAALLVAGVARSSARNGFWHDSATTFRQMVDDEPYSFKAHHAWGGHLFENGRLKDGEAEWRLAIALMPGYHGVYLDLAHKYREAHMCQAAVPLYRKVIALEPELPTPRVYLVACLLELGRWREARSAARVGVAFGNARQPYLYMIDRADSALVARDSIDPMIGAKWLRRQPR